MVAVTVHPPAALAVSVVPLVMVQLAGLVVTANVTAPVPEPPVLPKVAVAPPTVSVVDVEVAMSAAWVALLMVTDGVTCGAAKNVPLPSWFAAIVQVPALTMVTVLPLVPPVVQTPVVVLLKVTRFVDPPPVALTVKVPDGA